LTPSNCLQDEDARRRGRLVDLHAQRQVFALLALVHCPTVQSLAAAYQEFQTLTRCACLFRQVLRPALVPTPAPASAATARA
jgi:hypothetical protein